MKNSKIHLGFENFEVIKTEEDAKIFVETMENIPEPNDKLKKAFKEFDNRVSKNLHIMKNKKETEENIIEEAKKIWDELHPNPIEMALFGAKWQQEKYEEDLDAHLDVAKTLWLQVVKENKKMYSEEEVHNILNSYKSFISSGMKIPYFEWFEQFKK